MGTEVRSLLSADRLAFGVGFAALFAQAFYPPLISLVVLAVFLPSVLREIGVLHDADEWTEHVMHRAGFHALLTAVFVIFLAWFAPMFGATSPHPGLGLREVLQGEPLRTIPIYVFLVSYLLQYWGGRRGAQRVLLGVGLVSIASASGILLSRSDMPFTVLGVMAAIAALFVGLTALSVTHPRVSGRLLVGGCAVLMVALVFDIGRTDATWTLIPVLFQVFLILGITGIALMRDPADVD